MAREILLVSTSDGVHRIEMGLDNAVTSSFSIQMWITKYGVRMIDFVQAMSLNFISFMGGDLWVHNDDTVGRCNLFGEKRDCVIGVVSNQDPLKVKLYDSLGVHSTGEWEITEITIPASLNYPDGMYSKLPKERFKKRNGIFQAEFLRNMKTSSGTISIVDALNGEPLRGNNIYFLMKNTDNEQVKLFKIEVNATISKV
jgi:hypothetical protein